MSNVTIISMPRAEFFKQFGLIAFRNFLERDFCRTLREDIRKAEKEKGKYRDIHSGEDILNEEFKSRSEATRFESNINEKVSKCLLEILPDVSQHFDVEIHDIQTPIYCLYETGDSYGIHVDAGEHENIPDEAQRRKVSAIIFLNEESREPEEGKYCGGNLTFYGLNQNEAFAKFGMPLVGEQGMLITFPPTLPHEVTPVTSGERFTIATWFI